MRLADCVNFGPPRGQNHRNGKNKEPLLASSRLEIRVHVTTDEFPELLHAQKVRIGA
jgi:hypothetical protein